MNVMNESEISYVSGGFSMVEMIDSFAEGAAGYEGSVFFGAMAEGAELGAAVGPVGIVAGIAVGAIVAGALH